MLIPLLAIALTLPHGLPSGAVLHGEERRGAVLVRLEGAPSLSWQACASACGYNEACQAWTHHAWPQRCTLHNAPLTPRPFPGAVTGLSPALAAHIESAIERPPSAREQAAQSEPHPPAAPQGGSLPQAAQSQLFPEN
ncbi:MAG: PAN domain-containing protein [Caulobacterales bacterium]|uniref:PAN domain-containing protein n=1 Tax=Glycocaulis sp. TaxID=1969725 RepID=UPI003F9ED924